MGICKLCSILGGNHPAAVIDSPFYQWITRIKIILGFYIDNQTNQFTGYRSYREKADIIGNSSLRQRSVLVSSSLYHRNTVGFIRCNCHFSHLRRTFNIFFRNLFHITVTVFFQAVLHNPCQNNLLRKQPLAGRIIAGFVISHTDVFRYGSICIHGLTSCSY